MPLPLPRHVSRMDFDHRLPRRMLSAWVPHPRPVGAPTMTYGVRAQPVGKALGLFHLDCDRWHELAANRAAWRSMLKMGIAPAEYRPRPPSPPPPPLARTKPSRACAAKTLAAIDAMRARDAALLQILKPI